MNRFAACLAWLTGPSIEGGFSDHPNDRGGATNCGVTQLTYDSWRERSGLPKRPVREITRDEVSAVYRDLFWDACRCTDLPVPLDLIVFDSAVQHNPLRAAKWLQRIVGTTADGCVGEQTLYVVHEAVLAQRTPNMVARYLAMRETFYAQIIANDPSQRVFEKGWKNRMAQLRDAIK